MSLSSGVFKWARDFGDQAVQVGTSFRRPGSSGGNELFVAGFCVLFW